jgi:D-inositol-3-phosphate glycosyltransferase
VAGIITGRILNQQETMNIAMLSYHTCPLATLGGKHTGGMNVYVRELTHSLGKLGIHVDVFTRSQDEHVPHVLHDLGCGNRVVHIPAGPESPTPKNDLPHYLPEFTEGILKFSESKGIHYDLIHSHYWMSGVAAGSLRAEWNVPLVQMYHTLGLMKNRIARNASEMEIPLRIESEKQIAVLADKIVIATPAEKEQLITLYGADEHKMVVIPPGVDTTRFYPIPEDEARSVIGVPSGNCMILFVGRIEPLKGIETLLRAIALLLQTEDLTECNYYLAIIGGEPDGNGEEADSEITRLQNLSRELGIHDVVIFLGKRSQDTLPYYYSAAQVVVVPSQYESFGMVALEAMACGIPVIASQVGGLAYLVQDGKTGYVIPEGNPEALKQALKKLIEAPELRDRMCNQAVDYARSYDWSVIARKVARLYESMLTRKITETS